MSVVGKRTIDNWTAEGDAVINEYFVRLTPDRQSKSGTLWSRQSLGSGEFVTTVKFRISGQVRVVYAVSWIGSESVRRWFCRVLHPKRGSSLCIPLLLVSET